MRSGLSGVPFVIQRSRSRGRFVCIGKGIPLHRCGANRLSNRFQLREKFRSEGTVAPGRRIPCNHATDLRHLATEVNSLFGGKARCALSPLRTQMTEKMNLRAIDDAFKVAACAPESGVCN